VPLSSGDISYFNSFEQRLNSVAYPLHPNQAGEQNMADQVLAAPGG
jgi:hypothetical protein